MPRKKTTKVSVRLKNPVTGEIKFVEPNTDYHRLLKEYGWVPASMGEAIVHYRERKRLKGD